MASTISTQTTILGRQRKILNEQTTIFLFTWYFYDGQFLVAGYSLIKDDSKGNYNGNYNSNRH